MVSDRIGVELSCIWLQITILKKKRIRRVGNYALSCAWDLEMRNDSPISCFYLSQSGRSPGQCQLDSKSIIRLLSLPFTWWYCGESRAPLSTQEGPWSLQSHYLVLRAPFTQISTHLEFLAMSVTFWRTTKGILFSWNEHNQVAKDSSII